MSRCKSCMAPILWAHTPNGKRIPLDAEPVKDGNVYLTDVEGTAIVRKTSEPMLFPGPTYVSHFATCPNANDHRSPRKDRT